MEVWSILHRDFFLIVLLTGFSPIFLDFVAPLELLDLESYLTLDFHLLDLQVLQLQAAFPLQSLLQLHIVLNHLHLSLLLLEVIFNLLEGPIGCELLVVFKHLYLLLILSNNAAVFVDFLLLFSLFLLEALSELVDHLGSLLKLWLGVLLLLLDVLVLRVQDLVLIDKLLQDLVLLRKLF